MNLETKITIYKFTPQLFTLTLNMDLAGIYHKANILIAQTYGITGVPEKGYVIVTVNNVRYIVYFYKIESGWNIEKVEECL